jgi:Ner family transcriptional regulator
MKPSDWHPEDIKAEIRKTRITLRKLALDHGLNGTAINTVLRQPWPRVEAIVANRLGRRPQDIWPSRYYDDGTPKRGFWSQPEKPSASLDSAHRQKRAAA